MLFPPDPGASEQSQIGDDVLLGGASGAHILGRLAHELVASGGRYGVATLCIGVGQGLAIVLEVCVAGTMAFHI